VFAKLGYPVASLKRVRIGTLNLHGLGEGDWRFLRIDEVARLRDLARSDEAEPQPEAAPPARRRKAKKAAKPGRKPLPPRPASRRKASRAAGKR
jgi:hypothetical protein